jgi:hypothetical protein
VLVLALGSHNILPTRKLSNDFLKWKESICNVCFQVFPLKNILTVEFNKERGNGNYSGETKQAVNGRIEKEVSIMTTESQRQLLPPRGRE